MRKVWPTESVDVDASCEDVASGAGEVEGVSCGGELVENLGCDEGQAVAGASVATGAEGAGAGGVAVTVEPAAGVGPGSVQELHRRFGCGRHGQPFDAALEVGRGGGRDGAQYRVQRGDGVSRSDREVLGGAAEQRGGLRTENDPWWRAERQSSHLRSVL